MSSFQQNSRSQSNHHDMNSQNSKTSTAKASNRDVASDPKHGRSPPFFTETPKSTHGNIDSPKRTGKKSQPLPPTPTEGMPSVVTTQGAGVAPKESQASCQTKSPPTSHQQFSHSSTTDHPKSDRDDASDHSDKPWLKCLFSTSGRRKIQTPAELEQQMQRPTTSIDDALFNRIAGSILGMALGDALGAHVEFRPHDYLLAHPVEDLGEGGTWGLKKGQFTDDTSMALCLANSLIACQGFNLYDQLVRYKWWYRHGYMSSTGECFDIGNATRQSIEEFERRQQAFAKKNKISLNRMDSSYDFQLLERFNVYCSGKGVAGNGALMRLAPVPLFFYQDPPRAVEYSGQSGLITHGDRKVYDACRYYGALIVAVLHECKKNELLDQTFYEQHRSWFGEEKLHRDIKSIARGSFKNKKGYDGGIRGGGYIVKALEAALWAFWSDEDSFEKGALLAVNLGDDTDTTAAIYGQLAGAYYGLKKLPEHWLKHVYAKKFLFGTSEWIGYEGQAWYLRALKTGDITSEADALIKPPPSCDSDKVDDDPNPNPPPDSSPGLTMKDVARLSPDQLGQWLKSQGINNDKVLEIFRRENVKGEDFLRMSENDLIKLGVQIPRDYNLMSHLVQELKKKSSDLVLERFKGSVLLRLIPFCAPATQQIQRFLLSTDQNRQHRKIFDDIRQWVGILPDNLEVYQIELIQDEKRTHTFLQKILTIEEQGGRNRIFSRIDHLSSDEKRRASDRLVMMWKQGDPNRTVPVVRGWYACMEDEAMQIISRRHPPNEGFKFGSSAFSAARYLDRRGCLIMSYIILADPVPVVLDKSANRFRFFGDGKHATHDNPLPLASPKARGASASKDLTNLDGRDGLLDDYVIYDGETVLDSAIIYLKRK